MHTNKSFSEFRCSPRTTVVRLMTKEEHKQEARLEYVKYIQNELQLLSSKWKTPLSAVVRHFRNKYTFTIHPSGYCVLFGSPSRWTADKVTSARFRRMILRKRDLCFAGRLLKSIQKAAHVKSCSKPKPNTRELHSS